MAERGAVNEEAVDLTIASLRAYWDRHSTIAIAWPGGKDSTATLTLMVHLIETGELPRPSASMCSMRTRDKSYRRCSNPPKKS